MWPYLYNGAVWYAWFCASVVFSSLYVCVCVHVRTHMHAYIVFVHVCVCMRHVCICVCGGVCVCVGGVCLCVCAHDFSFQFSEAAMCAPQARL